MVSVLVNNPKADDQERGSGRILCEHPQLFNEVGELRNRTLYRFFAHAAIHKNCVRVSDPFDVAVLVPSFDERYIRTAIKSTLGSEYDLAWPGSYWLPETDAPF